MNVRVITAPARPAGPRFGQPDDPGRKRRFCSDACKQAAYPTRKRARDQARQRLGRGGPPPNPLPDQGQGVPGVQPPGDTGQLLAPRPVVQVGRQCREGKSRGEGSWPSVGSPPKAAQEPTCFGGAP